MAVPLAGYSTRRLLRASARARVYEAVRNRDQKHVVAKVYELGGEGVEARVEHEFHLLEQLDVEGVVRALGVERAGEQLVLLLDYVEGCNLEQFADGQPLALDVFLAKATSLAATLARVHERRIVHRDIKPSNVLVEAGTERVFIADFGISVLLESERAFLYDPDVLAGTLPYISPEQTGRTTREVDLRSDLYSLGATFYELLTGRRPFEASEPLELIHAHLARRPIPPRQRSPSVPAQLSAIVMKLLEKAPEHRYQSAQGLQADLERFADALARGEAEPSFELGEFDHPTRLQLPHQLYGRTLERASLQRELELVGSTRTRRLVLLGGAPGIGKSALLHSLHAMQLAISGGQGKLASGRFVAQQHELPYRAFVRAFTSLVEQILTESDERLNHWRRQLRRALGPIAGVVAAMVPELALVLGELPPVPKLDPGEARNRLHVALARFVSVFAEAGPLVLVLDDLQWADAGSIELLQVLMREGGELPVLFVGAYRSDALDGTPLRGLLDRPGDDPVAFTHIELRPLADAEVERMLAELLGREREAVVELAAIVSRKTSNNPLFIRQVLLHLEALGLLRSSREGWRWDVREIATAPIPDEVVGMMQAKLEGLDAGARELLGLAACIGSQFDAGLLAALTERSSASLAATLYALEQQGLIHVTARGAGAPTSYSFAHERVRELARAQLEPEARRSLHWDIGDALLARYADEAFGKRVFEVVDQLDAGLPVESMSDERRALLARLNLAAGQRALDSAAWYTARAYFDLAVELLGKSIAAAGSGSGSGSIDEHAFAAAFGQAQAMALQGEAAGADLAFAQLLRWPLSPSQRGMVHARRVRIIDAQHRPAEALDYGIAALAEFGLELPRKPKQHHVITAVIRGMRAVKSVTREQLLAMPAVSDEREAAIMHLLHAVLNPAWLSSQELWVIVQNLHAQRVMKFGYHPTAPQAIGGMAQVFMTMGNAKVALRLVEAAIEVATERVSTPAAIVGARASMLTMIGPQCRPFIEAAEPMEAATREATEIGERYVAGFIAALGLITHLEAGTHLREILEIDARLRAVDDQFGSREVQVIALLIRRLIQALIGEEGVDFLRVEEVETELSPLTRYAIITTEIWGRMMLGEVEEPWAMAQPLLADYERVLLGSLVVPRFTMVIAILAARRWLMANAGERRRLRGIIRKRYAVSKRWAKIGPANYQPMADIVGGLLAMVRGDGQRAMHRFEAARAAALGSGAHYVAGLASMCLADWAAHEQLQATERGARSSAREAFDRMGAKAIVAAIDRDYGPLGTVALPPFERSSATHSTLLRNSLSADRSGVSLDLATVLGTMQAIGKDLELEQVIARVLAAAIENAGADRGALLLERNDELALVAEGREQLVDHFMDEPVPLRDARDRLPSTVVRYVVRTGSAVVIDDVSTDSRFSADPYVARTGLRSLLCMPIVHHGGRSQETTPGQSAKTQIGALVLENHLNAGAFTPARLEVLQILLGQAASALDNARLYAALARSEAQWRSLVDGVPDIIALMDERGQLEFVNHMSPLLGGHDLTREQLANPRERSDQARSAASAQCREFAGVKDMSGYGSDPARLIGLTGDRYLDPESGAAWREAFAEVVGRRVARELEVCVAPDGLPRRWYATRIVPVEAGPHTKYLSISTDITDRKQLEAQVRQQQRLESIGTLASGVAHEINNPVQGILNYAELIHARAHEPETVREFCDEITRESERVAVIVKDLLAFSRQEREQHHERAALTKLVNATLSLIHAVMRKDNVRVVVDLPAELPPLWCRPQQIQQIVMNLVTNARDALNERYGSGYHEQKLIEIGASTFARAGAAWLRLSVADHGTGMPEDVRARIFDPFFTTKGRDKGTGLGLAVSHGIAVEHGGELRVESQPGVGTQFYLELPVEPEPRG